MCESEPGKVIIMVETSDGGMHVVWVGKKCANKMCAIVKELPDAKTDKQG